MKTQIITALSIAAVLGAAGSAYAINQSVLTTASAEETVIGSATPVLVPVEPKGNDIPDEYRELLEQAAAAKNTPLGTVVSSGAPAPAPAPAPSDDDSNDDSNDDSGSYDDDHDDEDGEDDDHDSEGEDEDEDEDENDDEHDD